MRILKPESVLAFNIGNEPDSYHYRDNATIFPLDYWSKGWFEDVASYAEALDPVLTKYFGTTKLISGESMSNESRNLYWPCTQSLVCRALSL